MYFKSVIHDISYQIL